MAIEYKNFKSYEKGALGMAIGGEGLKPSLRESVDGVASAISSFSEEVLPEINDISVALNNITDALREVAGAMKVK